MKRYKMNYMILVLNAISVCLVFICAGISIQNGNQRWILQAVIGLCNLGYVIFYSYLIVASKEKQIWND